MCVWWGVHRIVIVLKRGEVDLTCSKIVEYQLEKGDKREE